MLRASQYMSKRGDLRIECLTRGSHINNELNCLDADDFRDLTAE